MGLFTKLSSWLGVKKMEGQILVVGLDNSGKTTVLNFLMPESSKKSEMVPTVGFNVESFQTKQVNFKAFDMSGQGRYRNLWENYYREAHGVIFVVDSNDRLRGVVARNELDQMLAHKDLSGRKIPMLFLANKMDNKDAMNAVEVGRVLGLDSLKDRPWHMCASCAITGEGVMEGIEWLSSQIKEYIDNKGK